jgi:hypothetical protein
MMMKHDARFYKKFMTHQSVVIQAFLLRSKTFKGATCASVGAAYTLYKRLVTLNTPE